MALDNFRAQQITWDRASRKIYEDIRANESDARGRKLVVQVTNDGVVETLSGVTLILRWKSKNGTGKGYDNFTALDTSKGLFELYYTTGMLSYMGVLEAFLELNDATGRVISEPFDITVTRGVDDSAIEGSDSFTALENYIVKINSFSKEIDSKLDKNGSGQVTYSNLSQEVREKFTGGSVAVVGDDSVITTNITDRAVTPKKTTFFETRGKNLFDKNDVKIGKYVSYTSGVIADNSTYAATGFREVLPNTMYRQNESEQKAFFDKNKNFISGVAPSKTFTTPSNCKYAIFNSKIANLDTAMVELGSATTNYEPYASYIDPVFLGDIKKISLKPNKNLFDKTDVVEGNYISPNSGVQAISPGYNASDYTELIANAEYIKSHDDQFALYDEKKQFVKGFPNGVYKFTTTNDTKYARFTVRDEFMDTFQVEKGTVSTPYEDYNLVVNPDVLPKAYDYSRDYDNFVIVGKNDADFSTVQAALDSTSGDITIRLLQGTYREHLNIFATDRKVSILGADAENTIIRDDSGDYYKCPLNASGNIYVENVTFLSTHDDGTAYDIPAYAVHLDKLGGAGTATFRNCKMISHQNSGVGIGTRQDQTIILDNCEIIKLSDRDGGALYIHNAQASNVTNQKVITKNCIISTDIGFAVKVDDANTFNNGTNSPMDIGFYFNVLHSGTKAKNDRVWYRDAPVNGGVSGQIKLLPNSFGNNEDKLNA